MGPSILRKKRRALQYQQPQPISPSLHPHTKEGLLRPSLSLPDLTTPLLDVASWEGLPPVSAHDDPGLVPSSSFAQPPASAHDHVIGDVANLKGIENGAESWTPYAARRHIHRTPRMPDTPDTPALPHAPHTPCTPATNPPRTPLGGTAQISGDRVGAEVDQGPTVVRPRKTSLNNPSTTPIQFHRPFTPWQVVNNDTVLSFSPGLDSAEENGNGDFRTSRTKWGRERDGLFGVGGVSESASYPRMEGGWRKRSKAKGAVERLNVVVVGPKGVGKSR